MSEQVDDIMAFVDAKTAPSRMSQQKAREVLDDVIAEIKMRIEALTEEIGEDD